MRTKIFPLLVVCSVCLFSALSGFSQSSFRVNEKQVKAYFEANEPQNARKMQIVLPFENAPRNAAANVKLEILSVMDAVLAQTEAVENLRGGKQSVRIPLALDRSSSNSSDLLWYRLRYTITPTANADFSPFSGVVSLSEIMPEIFEIRAVGSEMVFAGMNYRVKIRAFHPVSALPTSGVKITGEVKLDLETEKDEDELKLFAAATTNRDGYATLDFVVPGGARLDSDGEVKIKAEKNGVVREADQDLDNFETQNLVYLNTDKPIYQPGQAFHVRGLYLAQSGLKSAKAQPEKELELTIEDEDDSVLYRQTVKTSRFGIASIDWTIPENAKLGTYRVKVEADDDLSGDSIYFKVSRYELPQFSVTAKPDKTFYLPGENAAEITVSADYLFGKPVTKGSVKIVREKDRRWNYKQQKWEVDEEDAQTGEIGADGKFRAKFDLAKTHESLRESDYRRFEDIKFAAYFTDATTNRTEQKRFDVRVTKEAVHVYVIGIKTDEANAKMPVDFYVSTFYADGAPAACDLEIKGKYENESENSVRTLARAKTNRFGAGVVEFSAPKPEDDNYAEDLQIKVFASDAVNRTGTHEEEIDFDADAKQIEIRAAKTIHKNGEMIEAEIFTSEADADVFVDVVKNWSVIESRLVKTKNGRAQVAIPFRADFKGELTVVAYFDDDGEAISDVRGIIYPAPEGLNVSAEAKETTYRPGAEAEVAFNVAAFDKSDKKAAETALGVVVFDKAIDERARTDSEFGGSYAPTTAFGHFAALVGDGKQFGGITVSLLNRLGPKAKIPEELQFAAEILLADANYRPDFFESDEYGKDRKKIFARHFSAQFDSIETILKKEYVKDFTHPANENSLKRILSARGVDFANLRDPWGTPYRAFVEIEKQEDALYIWSAGADKIFDRRDDFIVFEMKFKYFTPLGSAIDKAVEDYEKQTGAFVRDYAALRGELRKRNIDLDALKDRFGRAYRFKFGVDNRFYSIEIESAGADGKFSDDYYDDDFTVWTNRTDYFGKAEAKIQAALNNYANERKSFPKDEIEFREALKNGGIDLNSLRDGYNRPLYLELAPYSRYADKVKTEIVSVFGDEKGKEKMTITPVSQTVAVIRLRSAGADNVKTNADDFNLTTFSGVVSEQAKTDAKPRELKTETIFTGGKGAVRGTITDPQGAVVPGASVAATDEQTSTLFSAKSDENGVFLIANLPIGKYVIKAESPGFQTTVIQNVPVRASLLTELNFALNVGSVSSVVEVTADAASVQASTSYSAATVVERQITALPKGTNFDGLLALEPGASDKKVKGIKVAVIEETATPRLREYFPETLLWRPEIVTDRNGGARVKFKLGDNVTTWKVYAIASDLDGKIGLAEQEIKAFQPFFVDLEPPKILTTGDEIYLPTPVRNYTSMQQKVAVTMDKADWFSALSPANRQVEVAASESENAVFGFRAEKAIKAGKQKVTAIAGKDSDAIEKTIEVLPNGKEIVRARSEIFRETVAFDANFPEVALPNTQKAELKIYPNLLAHVAESVEGILSRPYGCGEQTISSTYPNVMILKVLRNEKDSKLKTQAKKFLREGYERLLGYQKPDGGFGIWAKDAPDVALTAYALRFLSDAGEFIEVDDGVVERAGKWLASQQRADGSWTQIYSWEKTEDKNRTKMISTYAARSLAMTKPGEKSKDVLITLQKALAYLKARNEEIDAPYALANYALALLDANDAKSAAPVIEKLEKMALSENGGTYWNLETNTPFYGWGTPGRIETTALVVQALVKFQRESTEARRNEIKENSPVAQPGSENNLISRGTTFLLKNKDRYGVWHSTQATVNVLDAILAVVGSGDVKNGAEKEARNQNRTAEIFVNSRKIKTVALPPSNKLTYPLVEALPVENSANVIEVKIGGNDSATMAQIVSTHYISWSDFAADGKNTNGSRQIRLDYRCDKTEARIMDEITCAVEAERVGFRGYGMLLAEIGIPPGAEVDRASLEKAVRESWSFSRYEILPDKIIVYLWANPGGTRFDFKFKPRYGISAQTAPSVVYDYYNDEARATIAPLKFSVK